MDGVQMTERTARAIRRRGGNLYIWEDSARMLHARAHQPDTPLLYDTYDPPGAALGQLSFWYVLWRLIDRD